MQRRIISAANAQEILVFLYHNEKSADTIASMKDLQTIEVLFQHTQFTLENYNRMINGNPKSGLTHFIQIFLSTCPTYDDIGPNYYLLQITTRLSGVLLELTQQKKFLEELNEKKEMESAKGAAIDQLKIARFERILQEQADSIASLKSGQTKSEDRSNMGSKINLFSPKSG